MMNTSVPANTLDTLVLNKSYEPIRVVSWQEAQLMIWNERAEVVEYYEHRTIRTIREELFMPSIIRIMRINKAQRKSPRYSKHNLWIRDNAACQYCGTRVSKKEATLDHVVPVCQGGKTTWENIVIACLSCNHKKGGRSPEQARMPLIQIPYRPKTALPGMDTLRATMQNNCPESWRAFLGESK